MSNFLMTVLNPGAMNPLTPKDRVPGSLEVMMRIYNDGCLQHFRTALWAFVSALMSATGGALSRWPPLPGALPLIPLQNRGALKPWQQGGSE
jgi:hypothetical protein